jgi:ATP-binding cassette subfamily F protein uup
VSHDREFLATVVTSTIVFEDDGSIREYVGGYSDWLRQGHELAVTDSPFAVAERKRLVAERRKQNKPKKLSYKDQRELDQLPAEIASLEQSIAEMQTAISDPEFYSQKHDTVQTSLQALADQQALLDQRIERWGTLEELQSSFTASAEES